MVCRILLMFLSCCFLWEPVCSSSYLSITNLLELTNHLENVDAVVFDVDGVLFDKKTKEIQDPQNVKKLFQAIRKHGKKIYFLSASFVPNNYKKLPEFFAKLEQVIGEKNGLWTRQIPQEFSKEMLLKNYRKSRSSFEPTATKFTIFNPVRNIISAYPEDAKYYLQILQAYPESEFFYTLESMKGAYTKDIAMHFLFEQAVRQKVKKVLFVDDSVNNCEKMCDAFSPERVKVFRLHYNAKNRASS